MKSKKNKKIMVARLSVISNSLLIAMKLIVGIISGSVSILSEAIHSSMDLMAAIIAFFAVRISDTPPDSKHPYGHGKIENISGVIEGILILVAAVIIIVESIKKLLGGHSLPQAVGIGALVMVVSGIVNIIVSRRLYKVARETGSLALEADALHLKTDVYTSLGVAAGLAVIYFTGIEWLDPVIAILVALFIVKESYNLIARAFSPLLDTSWSEQEVEELEKHLNSMDVNFHDLRTRVAGNYRFVDVHIELPANESVGNAHSYCDSIEEKLKDIYANLTVTIHVEPT
ncbi:MAG: cation diffusion facilitator family transporter [Bacteroidales bacterium]|jgi:cation diffusion facilitator family transporter